ncbi:hypothetical protein [Macrococcus carouselicus]|uniref:Uncharacterized protein n=1 Tax=Macrococcus carouselicus TaxID=69969 RepID=A0A9Q8CMC5_9STAP|nr:hypothetical protein [Macrococcus carouselicus]TDM04048.1 hypothetical protein ERX40_02440 [Macrococcus carouselicus]
MNNDNKLIILNCIKNNINPRDYNLKDNETRKVIKLLLECGFIIKNSDDKSVLFQNGSLKKFKLTEAGEEYLNEKRG